MRRFFMATGLALACTSATDPTLTPDFTAVVGEPIQLHVGDAVDLEGGWTIGFSEVVTDSRCPTSVTCVWAGDGAIELFVRRSGSVMRDTLHTLLDPASVTHEGLTIQLTELVPYPSDPGTIRQTAYVARLTTEMQ
jgi:hypothetical protein